jgi:hypothetical protein
MVSAFLGNGALVIGNSPDGQAPFFFGNAGAKQ